MTLDDMKVAITEMTSSNYPNFVKALISTETGIEDEDILELMYQRFMNNDAQTLLHEEFYH